jgi:hypothetical protein
VSQVIRNVSKLVKTSSEFCESVHSIEIVNSINKGTTTGIRLLCELAVETHLKPTGGLARESNDIEIEASDYKALLVVLVDLSKLSGKYESVWLGVSELVEKLMERFKSEVDCLYVWYLFVVRERALGKELTKLSENTFNYVDADYAFDYRDSLIESENSLLINFGLRFEDKNECQERNL